MKIELWRCIFWTINGTIEIFFCWLVSNVFRQRTHVRGHGPRPEFGKTHWKARIFHRRVCNQFLFFIFLVQQKGHLLGNWWIASRIMYYGGIEVDKLWGWSGNLIALRGMQKHFPDCNCNFAIYNSVFLKNHHDWKNNIFCWGKMPRWFFVVCRI